ncbi:hypothetical protein MJN69_29050, partial [Salmonella enterica subsp. enterica serovar Kentucky]|nr:hypothetical protein [Salmonella enterica subsp. enterica serovar Kentucky]
SHDIDLIYEISDAVYVLRQGQILTHGAPGEVFACTEAMEQAGQIAVSPAAFFTMVHFHKERFMKPENKIPVLTRLSDEMTAVVN